MKIFLFITLIIGKSGSDGTIKLFLKNPCNDTLNISNFQIFLTNIGTRQSMSIEGEKLKEIFVKFNNAEKYPHVKEGKFINGAYLKIGIDSNFVKDKDSLKLTFYYGNVAFDTTIEFKQTKSFIISIPCNEKLENIYFNLYALFKSIEGSDKLLIIDSVFIQNRDIHKLFNLKALDSLRIKGIMGVDTLFEYRRDSLGMVQGVWRWNFKFPYEIHYLKFRNSSNKNLSIRFKEPKDTIIKLKMDETDSVKINNYIFDVDIQENKNFTVFAIVVGIIFLISIALIIYLKYKVPKTGRRGLSYKEAKDRAESQILSPQSSIRDQMTGEVKVSIDELINDLKILLNNMETAFQDFKQDLNELQKYKSALSDTTREWSNITTIEQLLKNTADNLRKELSSGLSELKNLLEILISKETIKEHENLRNRIDESSRLIKELVDSLKADFNKKFVIIENYFKDKDELEKLRAKLDEYEKGKQSFNKKILMYKNKVQIVTAIFESLTQLKMELDKEYNNYTKDQISNLYFRLSFVILMLSLLYFRAEILEDKKLTNLVKKSFLELFSTKHPSLSKLVKNLLSGKIESQNLESSIFEMSRIIGNDIVPFLRDFSEQLSVSVNDIIKTLSEK